MKILFLNSWMHFKNENALINYKNIDCTIIRGIHEIDNHNLDEFDCVFSPSEPIDVSKYPNTKFIFGPHFSIFPDYKQIQDKVIEDYKKLLTETDGARIVELEKSIKQGMDKLNQTKREYVEEINKTIEGKIRSGSQAERKEYQKINFINKKIFEKL